MATRKILPPLKHTTFDEVRSDGTVVVSNEWYDWAMNIGKYVDEIRTILDDDNTDQNVTINDLLTADVPVFAPQMTPTITGGCGALTAIEFAPTQPNLYALPFATGVDTSADFHAMLPFFWAGKTFQVWLYWGHGAGGTAWDTSWELVANSTYDNESIILDFVSGIVVTDTGGVSGNLYIARSTAVPISSYVNEDGSLVSMRITRKGTAAEDTLDLTAYLLAVRFVLEGLPIPTAPTDPYFDSVVLLLHCDGADESTTITDSSQYARTGTGNANLKLSTTRSKFGASSLKVSQRNTGGIVFGPSADFAVDTDETYTMECWVYVVTTHNSTITPALIRWERDSTFRDSLNLYADTPKVTGDTEAFGDQMTPVSISANTWVHLAYTFDGTTAKVWADGTSIGSWTRSGTGQTTSTFYIGGTPSGGGTETIEVYMDEVRITIGAARYTATFTPPTAPFPNS